MKPNEFIQSFLEEKAKAYAAANSLLSSIHENYFDESFGKKADRYLLMDPSQATIEQCEENPGTTVVTTREELPKTSAIRKLRYHLVTDGGCWKISGIDRGCLACGATGLFRGKKCPRCKGRSWDEEA